VEPAESSVLQGGCHRVHGLVGIGTGLLVPMMESLAPGQPCRPGQRGLVDEFVSCRTADGLDMALAVARQQGLLVGPSSGAAIRCALEIASRPGMRGQCVVVVCASSGVRYIQHPQFKMFRDEAARELGGEVQKPIKELATGLLHHQRRTPMEPTTVSKVRSAVLTLVRDTLQQPALQSSDSLIAAGANSLTAMVLVGKLRAVLTAAGVSDVKGIKLLLLKEYLWGSVDDLVCSLLCIDQEGYPLPADDADLPIKASLVVQYCGG